MHIQLNNYRRRKFPTMVLSQPWYSRNQSKNS